MIEVYAKACQSLDGEPEVVDICDYFGGFIKDGSEKTISRLYFPPLLNIDARSSLRGLVNESFGIADNLGYDGKTNFKEVLLSFIAWGGIKQRETTDDSEPDTKRSRVVTFCQDPYTGSKDRHKNTLNY